MFSIFKSEILPLQWKVLFSYLLQLEHYEFENGCLINSIA